jgi:hypothetical protein
MRTAVACLALVLIGTTSSNTETLPQSQPNPPANSKSAEYLQCVQKAGNDPTKQQACLRLLQH